MQKADHTGHRSRMKKKLAAQGLDAFEPHEVLEILLYYAIPQRNTNDIAKNLIDRFYVNFNPAKGKGVSAPEEKRKLGVILSFGGMPEEEAIKVGEYVANCFRNTLFREVKIAACGGNGELGGLVSKPEQVAAVTELAQWLVS